MAPRAAIVGAPDRRVRCTSLERVPGTFLIFMDTAGPIAEIKLQVSWIRFLDD